LTKRLIVWMREPKDVGAEIARVSLEGELLSASGIAIGIQPLPYRIDYTLTTVSRFVTSELRVHAEGLDWHRSLKLTRKKDGAWSCSADSEGESGLPKAGGDPSGVSGSLDCDLGLCPLTNTMPVLRHGLLQGGEPVDQLVAWVSVPDLAVHPSHQRYSFVRPTDGGSIVRYESGSFAAELEFDDAGFVRYYPGLARQIGVQITANVPEMTEGG
jgi:hypothetical protein